MVMQAGLKVLCPNFSGQASGTDSNIGRTHWTDTHILIGGVGGCITDRREVLDARAAAAGNRGCGRVWS